MHNRTSGLPFEVKSNYFGCRSRGDFDIERHAHASNELFFLRQGKVSAKIGNRNFMLDSEQCICIPAEVEHSFVTLDRMQPFFYDSLHFDLAELCSPNERAFYPFYEMLSQHKSTLTFVVLSTAEGEAILSFLSEAVSLLKAQPSGYCIGCKAYLELILFKLMSMTEALETDFSPESGIAPAITYIEANYFNTIRVETLASVCCMSKFHFIRCFYDAMKQTPVEYINSFRIKMACRMLGAESEEKIISVALAVGFHDLSNFNRTFKRIIGMTPTEYRTNHLRAAQAQRQSSIYFEEHTANAPFYSFML